MSNNPGSPGLEKPVSRARRWLKQGLQLKVQIKSFEMQLSFLSDRLFSVPSSAALPRDNGQSSPPQERLSAFLSEQKAALEESLRKKINLYLALSMQMVSTINSCTDGKESITLTAWFIYGKKWSEIADMLSLSVKQSQRILEYALEKIILPEDAIWISPGNPSDPQQS